MKTKLCRPVLVEDKKIHQDFPQNEYRDYLSLLIPKHPGASPILSLFRQANFTNKINPQQLILISLDPDEKIEEGDSWIGHKIGEIEKESKLVLITPENRKSILHHVVKSNFGKVIATQDKISPEYIQQFIEEYNKGEVKDVEIEMITMNEGHNKPEDYPFQEIDIPKLTNGFITIIEKSNIEKQADLVEEIAFENLKVKEPITYTEEEVLEYLNSLNDLLEEKQYISNINEGVISTSNMSSKEINELNKREEYIQSITNDNFGIDVKKWFEQNRKK